MFRHMALIGCGLMGGSLALAMRRAGVVQHITGYSPSATTIQWAQQHRVIDQAATSVAEAVRDADLIVLAVPVAAMRHVFAELAAHMRADAIVTDVGSTKQNIIADACATLGEHVGQFVPAHPIAGKEVAGVQHADADLYRDRLVIVCPHPHNRLSAVGAVTTLWEGLGCSVQVMNPQAHDAAFAAISHLPHLAAFALMHSILHQSAAADTLALGGSGFRDFTRIAASDPAMWRDIFLCNKEEILQQLDLLVDALHSFARAIDKHQADTLYAMLTQASQARAAWTMSTKDNNSRL